jgi:osmoprotectant transport system ATP-binding protein
MSVLRLDAIQKSYSGTPVLAKTSLEFAQNKITAIIGRSGCGKSTLLRVCNGLVTPDHGTVELFDRPLDYQNLPALRRRLGYAVQGTGLFPHLDIRKNIVLLASLEGWDDAKIDHRLQELLQLTQLEEEKLTAYPHQLSGGQQQRVGLCRAMMLHPEVMLLDEPFAAIDPITRIDMHRQLLTLHQAEPSTVLLVTHDMHEAMRLADHIVVMSQGQITCQRTSESLRRENPGVEADELLLSLLGGAE